MPSTLIGDIGQPLHHGHSEDFDPVMSEDLPALTTTHSSVTNEEHEEYTRTKNDAGVEVSR